MLRDCQFAAVKPVLPISYSVWQLSPTLPNCSAACPSHVESDGSQPRHGHEHLVLGRKPNRLDEAPGQHDLACPEKLAPPCKAVGEPGQRLVRVPHDVGGHCHRKVDGWDGAR